MPQYSEIIQYRTRLSMYASMLADLSESDAFIQRLIDRDGLSEFELALCHLIEQTVEIDR